jgi:hypothetical protein
MLCDGCDGGEYHIYCCTPPMKEVPHGRWLCPRCVVVDATEEGGPGSYGGKRRRGESVSSYATGYNVVHEAGSRARANSGTGDAPASAAESGAGVSASAPHSVPKPARAATSKGKASKGGRTVACGTCSACLAPDCQTCSNCLDMPRYGGPGVKHQKCYDRLCQNKIVVGKGVKQSRLSADARAAGNPNSATSTHATKSSAAVEVEAVEEEHFVNKKLYGDYCWVNPGCGVIDDNADVIVYPYNYYSPYSNNDGNNDGSNDGSNERKKDANGIEKESYLTIGTDVLSPTTAVPPWDIPLSWPAEILNPTDKRIPKHLRETWEKKYPMKRKKGEKSNERYILRLLGPVLCDGVNDGTWGDGKSSRVVDGSASTYSWKEFIVMRHSKQMLTWKQGVSCGAVQIGLLYSGYIWKFWGWGRQVFEDAIVEAGFWKIKGKGKGKEAEEWERIVEGMEAERERERKSLKTALKKEDDASGSGERKVEMKGIGVVATEAKEEDEEDESVLTGNTGSVEMDAIEEEQEEEPEEELEKEDNAGGDNVDGDGEEEKGDDMQLCIEIENATVRTIPVIRF